MKQLENEIVKYEFIDGILFATFKINKIDIHVAKELLSSRYQFTEGKEFRTFIDVTNVKEIDKEARDLFGSEEGTKNIIKAAMYTESVLSAFLANFLLKVNLKSMNHKIRVFSNTDKAIAWLNK